MSTLDGSPGSLREGLRKKSLSSFKGLPSARSASPPLARRTPPPATNAEPTLVFSTEPDMLQSNEAQVVLSRCLAVMMRRAGRNGASQQAYDANEVLQQAKVLSNDELLTLYGRQSPSTRKKGLPALRVDPWEYVHRRFLLRAAQLVDEVFFGASASALTPKPSAQEAEVDDAAVVERSVEWLDDESSASSPCSSSTTLNEGVGISALHKGDHALIHLWCCRSEGKRWVRSLREAAHARHALMLSTGLTTLHTVAVAHAGCYCTVTWLPFLKQGVPQPSEIDAESHTWSELTSWKALLGVPFGEDEEKRTRVPSSPSVPFPAAVFLGDDDRYYCLPLLSHSSAVTQWVPPEITAVVRGMDSQRTNTSSGSSGGVVEIERRRSIEATLVDAVLLRLATSGLFSSWHPDVSTDEHVPQRWVDERLPSHTLSSLFHECGAPLRLLASVAAELERRCDAAVDHVMDTESNPQQRQRREAREMLRERRALLRVILRSEMCARVLKRLMSSAATESFVVSHANTNNNVIKTGLEEKLSSAKSRSSSIGGPNSNASSSSPSQQRKKSIATIARVVMAMSPQQQSRRGTVTLDKNAVDATNSNASAAAVDVKPLLTRCNRIVAQFLTRDALFMEETFLPLFRRVYPEAHVNEGLGGSAEGYTDFFAPLPLLWMIRHGAVRLGLNFNDALRRFDRPVGRDILSSSSRMVTVPMLLLRETQYNKQLQTILERRKALWFVWKEVMIPTLKGMKKDGSLLGAIQSLQQNGGTAHTFNPTTTATWLRILGHTLLMLGGGTALGIQLRRLVDSVSSPDALPQPSEVIMDKVFSGNRVATPPPPVGSIQATTSMLPPTPPPPASVDPHHLVSTPTHHNSDAVLIQEAITRRKKVVAHEEEDARQRIESKHLRTLNEWYVIFAEEREQVDSMNSARTQPACPVGTSVTPTTSKTSKKDTAVDMQSIYAAILSHAGESAVFERQQKQSKKEEGTPSSPKGAASPPPGGRRSSVSVPTFGAKKSASLVIKDKPLMFKREEVSLTSDALDRQPMQHDRDGGRFAELDDDAVIIVRGSPTDSSAGGNDDNLSFDASSPAIGSPATPEAGNIYQPVEVSGKNTVDDEAAMNGLPRGLDVFSADDDDDDETHADAPQLYEEEEDKQLPEEGLEATHSSSSSVVVDDHNKDDTNAAGCEGELVVASAPHADDDEATMTKTTSKVQEAAVDAEGSAESNPTHGDEVIIHCQDNAMEVALLVDDHAAQDHETTQHHGESLVVEDGVVVDKKTDQTTDPDIEAPSTDDHHHEAELDQGSHDAVVKEDSTTYTESLGQHNDGQEGKADGSEPRAVDDLSDTTTTMPPVATHHSSQKNLVATDVIIDDEVHRSVVVPEVSAEVTDDTLRPPSTPPLVPHTTEEFNVTVEAAQGEDMAPEEPHISKGAKEDVFPIGNQDGALDHTTTTTVVPDLSGGGDTQEEEMVAVALYDSNGDVQEPLPLINNDGELSAQTSLSSQASSTASSRAATPTLTEEAPSSLAALRNMLCESQRLHRDNADNTSGSTAIRETHERTTLALPSLDEVFLQMILSDEEERQADMEDPSGSSASAAAAGMDTKRAVAQRARALFEQEAKDHAEVDKALADLFRKAKKQHKTSAKTGNSKKSQQHHEDEGSIESQFSLIETTTRASIEDMAMQWLRPLRDMYVASWVEIKRQEWTMLVHPNTLTLMEGLHSLKDGEYACSTQVAVPERIVRADIVFLEDIIRATELELLFAFLIHHCAPLLTEEAAEWNTLLADAEEGCKAASTDAARRRRKRDAYYAAREADLEERRRAIEEEEKTRQAVIQAKLRLSHRNTHSESKLALPAITTSTPLPPATREDESMLKRQKATLAHAERRRAAEERAKKKAHQQQHSMPFATDSSRLFPSTGEGGPHSRIRIPVSESVSFAGSIPQSPSKSPTQQRSPGTSISPTRAGRLAPLLSAEEILRRVEEAENELERRIERTVKAHRAHLEKEQHRTPFASPSSKVPVGTSSPALLNR